MNRLHSARILSLLLTPRGGLLAVAATALTALTMTAAVAQTEPLETKFNEPAFQAQIMSVLAVNGDGTVRVADWTKARRLLGVEFAPAMGDLNSFNDKVLSGSEKGFKSLEELSQHAIVLRGGFPDIRELSENASSQGSSPSGSSTGSPLRDVSPSLTATAPYCRGGWIGQCRGDVCCCGGWWFFCTQLCSPCLYK